jgi:hypothetical protein
MRIILEITAAFLLVTHLLAGPVDNAPAEDQPTLGDRYEIGVLHGPATIQYFNNCIAYAPAEKDKFYSQYANFHDESFQCHKTGNFSKEQILQFGFAMFPETKELVPVAEFAKNSSLVLAESSERLYKDVDWSGDEMALKLEPFTRGKQQANGTVSATKANQRFTFEFVGRDEKHGMMPRYEIRVGESKNCLQYQKHEYFSRSSREILPAFVGSCVGYFSWLWIPIPEEVLKEKLPAVAGGWI